MDRLIKILCATLLVVGVPFGDGFAKEDQVSQVLARNNGWKIYASATGDLNHDGASDIAVILSKEQKIQEESVTTVTLQVYLADRSGKLQLKTEAPEAVCFACAGMKGGSIPFELAIKNGVLWLTWSGGSRDVFTTITKWRFRQGEFFLIGVSSSRVDTIADVGMVWSVEVDANISTLKAKKKTETVISVSPAGEVKTKSNLADCKVDPSFQKITLSKHSSEEFSEPSCK